MARFFSFIDEFLPEWMRRKDDLAAAAEGDVSDRAMPSQEPPPEKHKSGSPAKRIKGDAQPQLAREKRGSKNSGVASAEPRVLTGDEDATFKNDPDRHDRHGRS